MYKMILQIVEKFNPYHDSKGMFTGPGGYASFSANPDTKAGKLAIRREQKNNPLIGAAFGTKHSKGQIEQAKSDRKSEMYARKITNDYSVSEDRKAVISDIKDLYRQAEQNGSIRIKEDGSLGIKRSAYEKATEIARKAAENATVEDNSTKAEYDTLRSWVKNQPLKISTMDRSNIADFNEFRRGAFGNLNISNNGMPVDKFYKELSGQFPHLFDATKFTNPGDQLKSINDELNKLRPKQVKLSDEMKDQFVSSMRDDLIRGFFTRQSLAVAKSAYFSQKSRGRDMQTFSEILRNKSTVKKSRTFSEILKFNPYHDEKGRFTSGNGSFATFSANPDTKAGRMAIERRGGVVAAAHEIADADTKASDKAAIAQGIKKVRNTVSNEAKPLTRQAVDIDTIMKEGGCDRATAEKAAAEAKAIYDRVSKAEPQITADIVGAVAENSGKMYGLDYRMKQETSLGRKIASDALDPKEPFNGDLKAAAADVKDAVRYTAVFETGNFTQGYNNVKKSLEEKGYTEQRCKNFYADYAEGRSLQKAVQCVYSDKNGNRLELQFHTYESQGAKEVNHPLYEKSRAASTSVSQKKVFDERMTAISSNVPDPDGVMNIVRHK